MKTAIILLLIGSAYLYVSNEDYKEQLAIANERACIAQKFGERTVSERRRDGSVQCTSYENATYGMAPRFKYAEVWASR